MLSQPELSRWLSDANRRYSDKGIPHRRRPFEAMRDYTVEFRCSLDSRDPLTSKIFDWFYQHSPPHAHQMGSIYTGVYYYDTAFWPVQIPLIFGEVSVNGLDCLATMPQSMKQTLHTHSPHNWIYASHWANCMDYGYGQDDLQQIRILKPRAQDFFDAAHAELLGANSQLIETRPNAKSILGFRMATEIYFKAVLIHTKDLGDNQLKKISHSLEGGAKACADATGSKEFEAIAGHVGVFPPVTARYDVPEWPLDRVWDAALLAQHTAATVTRLYTDRNIRRSMHSLRDAQPPAL